MSRSPLLARKYARALFDATHGRADLAGLGELARKDPAILARPGITKKEIHAMIGGEPKSSEIRNFLAILLRRKRLRLLPEILETYELIAEEEAGIKRAAVTVASELGAAERAKLETALAATHRAKKMKLDVRTDPSIVGGITIRVGDRLVDGSVKSVLEEFRSRF